MKRITAVFYRTALGNEPVRDFLRELSPEDRLSMGRRIGEVEFGWPIGMPTARAMGQGLHELRCVLSGGRACRVFFFVDTNEKMVLLHAMVKKTQKTPGADLVLARQRMRLFLAENRR